MPNAQKNTIAYIMAENAGEQDLQVRLAGIEEESIVDGPGLRLSLFTQGCPHHCHGCHNPETHAFDTGTFYTLRTLLDLYDENPLLQGMTFSGGEPFVQAEILSVLGKAIHDRGGDIVTYTGYTFEFLVETIRLNTPQAHAWQALLAETDILIDGPYVEELRDLELTFRGSSNQRVLDRATREQIMHTLSPAQ